MPKRLLIISPYFPPVNAADMQRVRTSLPYFKNYNWEAEVVTVHLKYTDITNDKLLTKLIPNEIPIHYVKAFNKVITSKLGLGSIALRSLWFYRQKVNQLLAEKNFDLIYFSTTQFPVCILGAYWRKRFNIPYVIDMQDPWHSDYYQDKPKTQRPPKYWFSYRLNKYLEPIAIKNAAGLISVSEQYISDLKGRYPQISDIPSATITFGAFEADIAIAHQNDFPKLLSPDHINLVYIGRGGLDMHKAIKPLFEALKNGLETEYTLFSRLRLYFIGTSYAVANYGKQTIAPLAGQYGLKEFVTEVTDRISYYHTLATLQQANALFIPGSDDAKYTASKIYPYLLTAKPLLAVLHPDSPAKAVLSEFKAPYYYNYEDAALSDKITVFLKGIINNTIKPQKYDNAALYKYSSDNLTKQQCQLFNLITDAKI